MSRTFLATLACVFALLTACQPSQPTPSPTQGRGTTEKQNDDAVHDAGQGTASLPVADSKPVESAAAPVQTPESVNIDEIIELEFDGDDDFDMDLRPDGNPFPAEKVLLAAEVNKSSLDFRMVDVQAYERLTKDSGEARRVAANFLEQSLGARNQSSPEPHRELRKMGELAIELGSTDPLVRAELEASRIVTADLDDDAALIVAIEQLDEAGYRPTAQFIYYYHVVVFNSRRGTLTPNHGAEMHQYTMAWLQSEKIDDRFLRIAWNHLDRAYAGVGVFGMEQSKRFVEACLQIPDLDPWLKHMLVGRYYKRLAWHYRGGGWASEVTAEGGQKFENYLPMASKFFTRAWQLRPEFPEAAADMIGVAMAGGDTRYSPRGWFDCSIRAQFDYYAPYVGLHNALRPRWSGDSTALPRFIREVMETEQFDTEVPYWGLSLLRHNPDDYRGRGREIWDDPADYEAVRKMIQGYLNYEVPAISPDKLRSQLAAVASYTKDYVTAREAFAGLPDEQVDYEPFNEVMLSPFEARRLASVRGGPAAEKLAELDWSRVESEFLQVDDLDVFETQLNALRQLDEAPASRSYWDGLERPIAWRKAYLTGDWVDLTFAEGLPGWSVSGAQFEVESANSVVITSWHRAPPMQLRCGFPVEPPYIVEVDVENNPPSEAFHQLGVIIDDFEPLTEKGRYLWIDPSRQLIGRSKYDGPNTGDKFEFQDRTRIRVHVWNNEYERFLNDIRVDGERIQGLADRGKLGFGTAFWPSASYSIRFSNIRVRQLKLDPPSAAGIAPERN